MAVSRAVTGPRGLALACVAALGLAACAEDDVTTGVDAGGVGDASAQDVAAGDDLAAPSDDVATPADDVLAEDTAETPDDADDAATPDGTSGPLGTWSAVPLGLGEDFVLKGVTAAGPQRLIAVGNKATVLESVDGVWSLVHQNTALDTLNAVWAASADEAWAVGAYGAILRRTAAGWTIGTGCTGDAACDDSDPCTVDRCNVDGQCQYDPSGQQGCCGTASLSDGFEGGLGTWTVEELSGAGVTWHTSTHRAAEGSRSLYFGVPDLPCVDNSAALCPNFDGGGQIVSAQVTSAPITLPSAASITASFQVILDAESSTSWDKLELRVVDGDVETTVWTKDAIGGATGTTFAETQADLTPWAGQQVALRFWFDSVDSGGNQYEGAYIDALRVDSTCGDDLATHFPTLFGVFGFSSSNVYAVGNQGVIVHFDGTTWKRQTGGDTADLFALTGSADQLLAAGGAGEVVSTLGGGGLGVDRATLGTVYGATLLDDGRPLLCGEGGALTTYSGGTWTAIDSGVSGVLHDTAPLPGGGALAVGADGTILKVQGTTVTPEASGTTVTLYSVWTTGETLAVGEKATVLSRDAVGTWTPVTLPSLGSGADAELRDVIVFGDGNAVAVGGGGTIVERTAGTWKKGKLLTTYVLHGVWGALADDVWAVGNSGMLLHRVAGTWSKLDDGPIEATLYDVWGRSASEVYAVGAGGVLARWDGTAWTLLRASTAAPLRAVWGPTPSDLYAVGDGPTVMRFDGLLWSTVPIEPNIVDGQPQPVTGTLYDVAGAADAVVAVGQDGLLLERVVDAQGVRFRQVPYGTGPTLRGVVMGPDKAILAVGREGHVQVLDPAIGPLVEPSGTSAQLYDVLRFDDGRAVAVGDRGTIVQRTPPQ